MDDDEFIEDYLQALRAYNKDRSRVNQERVDARFFVLPGSVLVRAIHLAKGEGLITPDKG